MKNKITKNLESLRDSIQMPTSQKKEVEDFLMNRIALETSDAQHARIPVWLKLADALMPANLAFKPIAVFSLVLGLFLITSFASVNAAKNTLPGNVLYPVKITAENIKYNLAFSDTNKAKAAMSMVENRVSELKVMVKNQENGEQKTKVAQTTSKLKKSLSVVAEKVQNVNQKSDGAEVVAVAKEIDKKLAVVGDEINEVVQDIEDGVSEELAQVVEEMGEASKVVLAVLVEAEAEVDEQEAKLEDENEIDNKEDVESPDEELIEIDEVVEGVATSTASSSEQLTEDEKDIKEVLEAEVVVPVTQVLGIQEQEESQEFKVGIE